jgi:hypothetical protein
MMDHNTEMGVMLAVTALRNALLRRDALTQADIDHEVGEIFGRMALDKALGARTELLGAYDMTKVERVVREMLSEP